MKTTIATNLVGKSAQITMGVEVNDNTRACYKDAIGVAQYFGEKCEIVAVYQTAGELMATVKLAGFSDTPHGGKLIECFVSHLRLIEG